METTKKVENRGKPEPRSQSDETMWAVFCHLGGLFGAMIPPGNIILPLVIWLSQREKYPFVDDQGKEAINFQISLSIYFIASAILIIIGIGLLLILGLAVFALIVTIMAALKASAGSKYRYPLTMRFLA